MSRFFNLEKPITTLMINRATTPDIALEYIKKGIENGADAFGLLMDKLETKYRTRECLTELFSAMEGRPCYVTNYRRSNCDKSLSDEALAEQLLLALDCGAVLIDIFGDMFGYDEFEVDRDEKAGEKQKKLADTVHSMGGEVLISSHTFKYMTPEEVLDIARLQVSRGADIAKIVTAANTDEELKNNLDTVFLLREKLGKDSLFLCNGSKCFKHRRMGPIIAGSSMFLCVNDREEGNNQPTIAEAKKLIEICMN